MACVNLPELPLQLLLKQHPDWKDFPVVVVDQDKASGVILWVNERARADQILPGMRYAAGLSLSRELRGGVVDAHTISQAADKLVNRLDHFSPGVEPCEREPGIFWLEAQGLIPLYASLSDWAKDIHADLKYAGYHALLAVGFTRFGSYAAAKSAQTSKQHNRVFSQPEEEQAFIRHVPLNRLGVHPRLRNTLHKLGIDTLGPFSDLPGDGIRKRFGREAYELHRAVIADDDLPIQPSFITEPIERAHSLEHPEKDQERLLNGCEQLLHEMLSELRIRSEALSGLELRLTLDDGKVLIEKLRPAGYTRELKRILPLLRLRLETLGLSAGVVDLYLRAQSVRITSRQLDLLEQATQRDLDAVHRAFAEIRAELGNQAVVHARLHDRHLPEARFTWDPIDNLPPARFTAEDEPALIRRVYSRPLSLPRPMDVKEMIGPHVVSGAWWSQEVARSYYYLRAESGRWFWVYKDLRQGRWFLHGEVG